MSHVVEIDELSKSYGTFHAVRDLTLQVDSGEIVALLGPNGAGKTTTIRMLMGLLQPHSGTARVLGFDCFAHRAEVKSMVGYLPDEPVFFDYLRGREVVRFVGGMQGLSAREIEDAAEPLVERLEIASALDEFAMNYSAGMKKKLALTCALLHDPKLLILDEPTNGLDPLGSRSLMAMIRERAAEGCAVFYSTHLLDQAERICHRIAIMRDGQLAALGPMAEVRESLAPGGSLEDAFFEVAGSRAPVESSE